MPQPDPCCQKYAAKPDPALTQAARLLAWLLAQVGWAAALLAATAPAQTAATAGRRCTRPAPAEACPHPPPVGPAHVNKASARVVRQPALCHTATPQAPPPRLQAPLPFDAPGLDRAFLAPHPLIQGNDYRLGSASSLQRCLQVAQGWRGPRELQALLPAAYFDSNPHTSDPDRMIGSAEAPG